MDNKSFVELLAKLTGKADQVGDLYKPGDEGEEVLREDASDVLSDWIRSDKKRVRDESHGWAKKTAANEYRKRIAGLIDYDGPFDDDDTIFEALHQRLTSNGKPGTITEDKIRSHPAFQKALDERAADLSKRLKETEANLAEQTRRIETDRLRQVVYSRAFGHLRSINANLGATPEVIAKREGILKRIFDADIEKGRFKLENDKLILLDESGTPARDSDLRELSMESYVSELNPYGVHQGNPNHTSPSPAVNGHSTTQVDGRSADELRKAWQSEKDPAKRAALGKAFMAHRS